MRSTVEDARNDVRHVAELMRWAEAFEIGQVPPPLLHRAKLIVLDTLGVMLAGSQTPELSALTADLARGEPGSVVAVGTPHSLAAGAAAFVNGMAASWHDFDETHFTARQHGAAQLLPSALAAIGDRSSGADLLSAFVSGYEVSGRVGRATQLRSEVMVSSGTYGVIGAAVTAAKMLGCDRARLFESANIAAGLSLATSLRAVAVGATMRNAYSGLSARNGLLAVSLAAAGVTGDAHSFKEVFGSISGHAFDDESLVSDLGSRFLIQDNFVKRFASCADSHPAISAVSAALDSDSSVMPDQIREIRVHVHPAAQILDNHNTYSELVAKYSMNYGIASWLIDGGLGTPSFSDSARLQPARVELMKRVRVIPDLHPVADVPSARADVELSGGVVLSGSAWTAGGRLGDPHDVAFVDEKFFRNATPVLGRVQAERVHDLVLTLEQQPSARELLSSLIVPVTSS